MVIASRVSALTLCFGGVDFFFLVFFFITSGLVVMRRKQQEVHTVFTNFFFQLTLFLNRGPLLWWKATTEGAVVHRRTISKVSDTSRYHNHSIEFLYKEAERFNFTLLLGPFLVETTGTV